MKPKEFKDLLERVSKLTAKQRVSMLQALEAPVRNESLAIHEIEAGMDFPLAKQIRP